MKVPTNESVSTFTGQKSTLELIKLLVWEREAFFGLFLEIHNCTLCSQCQIEDSEDFVVQLIKISSFFSLSPNVVPVLSVSYLYSPILDATIQIILGCVCVDRTAAE